MPVALCSPCSAARRRVRHAPSRASPNTRRRRRPISEHRAPSNDVAATDNTIPTTRSRQQNSRSKPDRRTKKSELSRGSSMREDAGRSEGVRTRNLDGSCKRAPGGDARRLPQAARDTHGYSKIRNARQVYYNTNRAAQAFPSGRSTAISVRWLRVQAVARLSAPARW